MIPLPWAVLACVVALSVGLGSGWKIKTWYADSAALEAQQAAEKQRLGLEAQRDQLTATANQQKAQLTRLRHQRPAVCNASDEQLRVVREAIHGPMPKTP